MNPKRDCAGRTSRDMAWRCGIGISFCWLVLAFIVEPARGDSTWLYAVQISAEVQKTPAQLKLNWEPDAYATNYAIYRKGKTDTTWGKPIAALSGAATNYTDTNVVVGTAYEYQITKGAMGAVPYTGYGYIYSGIEAPLTEGRGTLVLIVETNATASLSNELARLESDLVGDGWRVLRHGVSSNDTPDAVRTVITNDYYADPAEVNAVFLFGHVPVLESGEVNYDGHETRPMPADGFYGDVSNDWPTDPSNSPSFFPSEVKLMVGRVDFFNMPGWPPTLFQGETELLRNYLNKDHKWRQKQITVPRRALMGNSRGDEGGEAVAASGYRNFEPMVGPGNTIEANTAYLAPPEQRWISVLATNAFLWAYGCGGGSPTSCGMLGTNTVGGVPGYLYSVDVVANDAKAVFVMLFGSWFGEWDLQNDLMRAFLATPTMGLTCCMGGRPHWFTHHMGLGETIGYGARLTMNNSDLYQSQINALTQGIYISLMGDPTLRMEPVAPATNLKATLTPAGVALSWSASADPVQGYHVYRADSADGPFTRLSANLVAGTSFVDTNALTGPTTYMVRAILLQTNPSGSYYNPSQGAFAAVEPVQAAAHFTAEGLLLSWSSSTGAVYHVMGAPTPAGAWTDLSGGLKATNSTTFWLDGQARTNSERFYRITSP